MALGAAFALSSEAEAAIVSNTADAGANSLRQAVLDTNASAMDDSIVFTASVTGTITLTSGELLITDEVTITGPGANVLAVSGNNAFRVFNVNPTTAGDEFNLYDITVRNAFSTTDGGGIRNEDANVTLTSVTLTGNVVTGISSDGGAFYDSGAYDNGEQTLIFDSTIGPNNTAGDDGGGVYGRDSFGGIYNTTIVGNTAVGSGGGAYSYLNSYIGESTVAGNASADGGGIRDAGSGDVTIGSTILADNTATNGPDFSGQLEASFSLIKSTAGATITGAPNITGQDPQLGPLQNNGGPTLTRRPAQTSPVLDKGFSSLPADQRGSARRFDIPSLANPAFGNGADIGSVELTAAEAGLVPPTGTPQTPVTTPTPTPAAKKCKKKKKAKKGASAAAKCKKKKKK